MSTQVAGVLIDPFERPLANTVIDIRTINNNFALLPGPTVAVQTNAQGEYNFVLEPASYAISVQLDGRSVYQGAITVTSTTAPGTLPELLKQAQMEAELPINYAEYFHQVQTTVKDDADRAKAAADSVGDELELAQQAAGSAQQSASSASQSSNSAEDAYQSTKAIADKFTNLDAAVTQTQQNAAQTQEDAQQTAADRQAAEDAAERAEQAAESAETVNERNLRVPTNETIQPFGAAATRQDTVVIFDSSGQAALLPQSGFANLDSGGKIPLSQLPATVINETFPASSEAEMLALNAQQGDVAARTDLNRSFILKSAPASTLSNWIPLLTNPVVSVNNRTGVITLLPSDIPFATKGFLGAESSGQGKVISPASSRQLLDAVSSDAMSAILSFVSGFGGVAGRYFDLPPMPGFKNGIRVHWGVDSGDKVISFDKPFNNCFMVTGTMIASISGYVMALEVTDVKPWGFSAHPRFINNIVNGGNTGAGTPSESYYWLAIGDL